MATALLTAAGMVLAASPAARANDGCASAPVAGGYHLVLPIDGRDRAVLVHVPRGIARGRRVPLVLVLHGSGGTGPVMEHYSGFSHASDLHGFIAAYPSSRGPVWNITAARDGPSDVAFIGGLIARLQQTMCLDPRRIFAAGVSNGGGMVGLLACALSTRLAAIAAVAGVYDVLPPCHPKRPLSVLEIHGTADPIAPYFGPGVRSSEQGPPPWVRGWVHHDRCGRYPSARGISTRTILYRWAGCAEGASVEHIRIVGGNHQWPGALPPDPGPPSSLCAACQIWSFFSRQSHSGAAGGSGNGGAGIPG